MIDRAETIVAAAIRYPVPDDYRAMLHEGRRLYPDHIIISAPPPARHPSLMHPFHDITGGKQVSPMDQGFITSTGRYVGREEALQIALASGQPMIDHPSRHARDLFSEDLW